MNPIEWIFAKLEMAMIQMSPISRKPTFQESSEFKPVRGWMLIYSEQKNIYFHHGKELTIYAKKEDADFGRRTHGMLAGYVKVVPCELKILEPKSASLEGKDNP